MEDVDAGYFRVLALSPSVTDLLHIATLIFAWAFTLAMTAMPLLLKFLNCKPVARCAVLQAAASFIMTGVVADIWLRCHQRLRMSFDPDDVRSALRKAVSLSTAGQRTGDNPEAGSRG